MIGIDIAKTMLQAEVYNPVHPVGHCNTSQLNFSVAEME